MVKAVLNFGHEFFVRFSVGWQRHCVWVAASPDMASAGSCFADDGGKDHLLRGLLRPLIAFARVIAACFEVTIGLRSGPFKLLELSLRFASGLARPAQHCELVWRELNKYRRLGSGRSRLRAGWRRCPCARMGSLRRRQLCPWWGHMRLRLGSTRRWSPSSSSLLRRLRALLLRLLLLLLLLLLLPSITSKSFRRGRWNVRLSGEGSVQLSNRLIKDSVQLVTFIKVGHLGPYERVVAESGFDYVIFGYIKIFLFVTAAHVLRQREVLRSHRCLTFHERKLTTSASISSKGERAYLELLLYTASYLI